MEVWQCYDMFSTQPLTCFVIQLKLCPNFFSMRRGLHIWHVYYGKGNGKVISHKTMKSYEGISVSAQINKTKWETLAWQWLLHVRPTRMNKKRWVNNSKNSSYFWKHHRSQNNSVIILPTCILRTVSLLSNLKKKKQKNTTTARISNE